MVDVARKMLFHDRTKFAITVIGVAFAVTLVLVQIGLFRGLLKNATITIDRADAELWVMSKNTPNIDFPHYFPDSYIFRVRAVPGVLRAENLGVTYMAIQLPNGAEETFIMYSAEDFSSWNLPWKLPEGRLEDLRRGNNMLLDDSATRRFGAFRVGESREIFGRRLDIVGRTTEAKSFTTMPIAFCSMRVAQDLNPAVLDHRTAYMLVKLAPGANAAEVAKEIRKRLPYNDVFTREEWSQRSRDYWIVNTGLGLNMGLTVFLGCLVGIVIVAQTLYASTMDHIKEFGTLKAIGGSDWDVYGIVMRQALIAAVLGFVVGLGPSLGLQALARYADVDLIYTLPFVGIVFVGTVTLCALAAVVSFRKIASIDPALVFRG